MKQNREIWRDIIGYEGYYEASNLGRIRSLDRTVITKRGKRFYKGKIMEGSFDKGGYKRLPLSKDGISEYFYIHQLVAMVFLNHTPDGHTLVVDHINGIRTDNRAENLQIVSHRENLSTCYRANEDSLTSDFAGVTYHKQANKWQSYIQINNKNIYLGLFDSEIDAAKTYQKALAELENGTLNPEDYKPKFTSNYKGITFHKASQKWMCQPYINGRQIYLGRFENEDEAFQAILEYESIQPIVKNC